MGSQPTRINLFFFFFKWSNYYFKVETGPNGGFPIQIHLPAEEILIQVHSWVQSVHKKKYMRTWRLKKFCFLYTGRGEEYTYPVRPSRGQYSSGYRTAETNSERNVAYVYLKVLDVL